MKRVSTLFLLLALCALLLPACKRGNGNANSANGASSSGNNAARAARPSKPDAEFAQETVNGLLNGDGSYADAFDWENLRVPGADAGAAYRSMPDETNRESFRQAFIEKFSESFKRTGATTSSLKNWREQGKTDEATTVTAETQTGKKFSVKVVHRDGQQLVSELVIE